MRLRRSTLIAATLLLLAACQRNEPPAPVPAVSPTPAIVIAPTPVATVAAAGSPRSVASPGAEDAAAEEEDEIDKPWGPEFEIDADANWYYGFPPMDVSFSAKPLNGVAPFTYEWDFGDGSPKATGVTAQHRYDKLGRYMPFVVGTDRNGEKSRVDLIILVVTAEEYANRKGVDISQLIRPTARPTP
jgi:PKD repeat protein